LIIESIINTITFQILYEFKVQDDSNNFVFNLGRMLLFLSEYQFRSLTKELNYHSQMQYKYSYS